VNFRLSLAVLGAGALFATSGGTALAEHGEDPPPDPTDDCHQTTSYDPFSTDRAVTVGNTTVYADVNTTIGLGYPIDAYAGVIGTEGYIEAETGTGPGVPSPYARIDGEEQGFLVNGEGLEGYASTEDGICERSDYFPPIDHP